MEYKVKAITPLEAAEILIDRNKSNRNVLHNRVHQYSRDMLAGKWTTNGDPIRFDKDDNLVDGQHRLHAIVESSTTQEFIIITGLDHDAIYTIDTGKARNGGDVLAIDAGVPAKLAQTYSAALKVFGFYRARGKFPTGGGHAQTNSEVSDLYHENHQLLTQTADWLLEAQKGQIVLLNKGKLLALAMIFADINENDAFDFIIPIITGAGLEAGTTQKHLRDVLIKDKSKAASYSQTVILNTFVKCWNSYRAGRNISLQGNVLWRTTMPQPIAK